MNTVCDINVKWNISVNIQRNYGKWKCAVMHIWIILGSTVWPIVYSSKLLNANNMKEWAAMMMNHCCREYNDWLNKSIYLPIVWITIETRRSNVLCGLAIQCIQHGWNLEWILLCDLADLFVIYQKIKLNKCIVCVISDTMRSIWQYIPMKWKRISKPVHRVWCDRHYEFIGIMR